MVPLRLLSITFIEALLSIIIVIGIESKNNEQRTDLMKDEKSRRCILMPALKGRPLVQYVS